MGASLRHEPTGGANSKVRASCFELLVRVTSPNEVSPSTVGGSESFTLESVRIGWMPVPTHLRWYVRLSDVRHVSVIL